jgi:hypothetical protein
MSAYSSRTEKEKGHVGGHGLVKKRIEKPPVTLERQESDEGSSDDLDGEKQNNGSSGPMDGHSMELWGGVTDKIVGPNRGERLVGSNGSFRADRDIQHGRRQSQRPDDT